MTICKNCKTEIEKYPCQFCGKGLKLEIIEKWESFGIGWEDILDKIISNGNINDMWEIGFYRIKGELNKKKVQKKYWVIK